MKATSLALASIAMSLEGLFRLQQQAIWSVAEESELVRYSCVLHPDNQGKAILRILMIPTILRIPRIPRVWSRHLGDRRKEVLVKADYYT